MSFAKAHVGSNPTLSTGLPEYEDRTSSINITLNKRSRYPAFCVFRKKSKFYHVEANSPAQVIALFSGSQSFAK